MSTFLIGLVILIVGGYAYGKFIETRIVKPDDRITPAHMLNDGIDFVPMRTWRNALLNLISIAGTGPIIGPIQGILFGPIAFILIPIGCVFAGATHDYLMGHLSLRNRGAQMPQLVKKFTTLLTYRVYVVFTALLLFLVAAVFIYTPGDLFAIEILGMDASPDSFWIWAIYGVILIYYTFATLMPIHKVIGRIYPILGFVIVASAVGLVLMLGIGFLGGQYQLDNLNASNWRGIHPAGTPVIPIFFLTVACGILSGFHSTQNTMVARSVPHEKHARTTFFTMMITEGFLAMVWAAAAMAVMNSGLVPEGMGAIAVIGVIANNFLGPLGIVVVFSIVLLAVTSGDTCLRALRLIVADNLKMDQAPWANRLKIATPILLATLGLLIWAKTTPAGFTLLWRYLAWSNQTIGIFALAIGTIYLIAKGQSKACVITLIPGNFYTFVTMSYIFSSTIGFRLPLPAAYLIAALICVLYTLAIIKKGRQLYRQKDFQPEAAPQYPAS